MISVVLQQIKDQRIAEFVRLNYEKYKTQFDKAPAGANNHHNYEGGLFLHSFDCALLAGKIADHFTILGHRLDKDVCVAGAFIHDLGKIDCYKRKKDGTYESTKASKYYHHIPIGFAMAWGVYESMDKKPSEGRVRKILHCILSHHGRLEYHSPVIPKNIEGWIVAHVDFLDSYINAPPELKSKFGK